MSSDQAASSYPATLDVDYPDRPLNRLTTFFRVFTVIPIAIVLGTVSGGTRDLLRRLGVGARRRSSSAPAACCSPGRC